MNKKQLSAGGIVAIAVAVCAAIVSGGSGRHNQTSVLVSVATTTNMDSSATARISGITRNQVVTPIIANCSAKLRANPETASLPADYVDAWCSCNANEIADHMTNQDVMDLQSGVRSQATIIQPKAEAAVAVCEEKIKLETKGPGSE